MHEYGAQKKLANLVILLKKIIRNIGSFIDKSLII